MISKLKQYVSGDSHYTPIMNIIMNNRSKDWYDELGKYITETIDISNEPSLSFFASRISKKNLITKVKDFITGDIDVYSSIAIFFLTSTLDAVALKKIFGEPIYHSEFGEGFDNRKIKESYASYFVNLAGKDLHIGFDHRGTSIEIGVEKSPSINQQFTDEDAKTTFECLKEIVNLYKEKI
jgi:hypothetical protein